MYHISGYFLEKNPEKSSLKKTVYKLSDNLSYIYKETIVYPYVNIKEERNELSLSADDYTDILYYIESRRFHHIFDHDNDDDDNVNL